MKLPSGFRIGHYTNRRGLTGCTVILCPPNTIGGCDVRGNSPASRETPLLAADKAMQEIHAVVLSGGSAFGLAAADGVMEYLESRRIGYRTPWARIPIVAAAAIFDLNIGSAHTRPDRRQAIRACQSARRNNRSQGNVGAGTGATVGKWAGADYRMKGGLGLSSIESGKLIVGCIAVVNCVGDVVERDGSVLAGARSSDGIFLGEGDRFRKFRSHRILAKTNTTLIVLMTNAALSKVGVNRLASVHMTAWLARLYPCILRTTATCHSPWRPTRSTIPSITWQRLEPKQRRKRSVVLFDTRKPWAV